MQLWACGLRLAIYGSGCTAFQFRRGNQNESQRQYSVDLSDFSVDLGVSSSFSQSNVELNMCELKIRNIVMFSSH